MPIPLLPDDPEVTLDLQAAFRTAYDPSLYDRRLPYDQPLLPALSAEDEAWVRDQLREFERRPAGQWQWRLTSPDSVLASMVLPEAVAEYARIRDGGDDLHSKSGDFGCHSAPNFSDRRAMASHTSSIPWPVPRFREYCFWAGLFQCSWTPRLSRTVPSPSGS